MFLYRKPLAGAILGLFLASALPGTAQFGRQQRSQGPRALAVVEWVAVDGKAVPRLRPVTILIDGEYRDASIYKASPEPWALESGNVYEAEHNGASAGFFTVQTARKVGQRWYGYGRWEPHSEKEKKSAEPSEGVQVVLRRPGSEEDEGPPVLRRPGGESQPRAEPGPERTTEQSPESRQQEEDAQLAQAMEDPNRPILRRGKPKAYGGPTQAEIEAASEAKTEKAETAAPAGAEAAIKLPPAMVAISDAHPAEPHPYLYDLKPEEEERLRSKMQELAAQEIAVEAGLKQPQKSGLKVQDFRVFDLQTDNLPEMVLIAQQKVKQQGKEVTYQATVIATEELDQRFYRLFSRVTSDRYGLGQKMELVDAVDADGDGRGELLFRVEGPRGSFYDLYRVDRFGATELYAGVPTQ